jgi:hypothetical protein
MTTDQKPTSFVDMTDKLDADDPMHPKLAIVKDSNGEPSLSLEVRVDDTDMAACAVKLDTGNWIPLVLIPARALQTDEALLEHMTDFAQKVAAVVARDIGTQSPNGAS